MFSWAVFRKYFNIDVYILTDYYALKKIIICDVHNWNYQVILQDKLIQNVVYDEKYRWNQPFQK